MIGADADPIEVMNLRAKSCTCRKLDPGQLSVLFYSRVLFVQRIEAGWPVGRAAEAGGVSARTAYRWLSRFRSGDQQLSDRSSAPLHCPHRLAAEQIAAVEQLRRERLTGPAIARALGMARSTVGLILRRLGLNHLALLEPKPPVNRYERKRPGELIHIDILVPTEPAAAQGISLSIRPEATPPLALVCALVRC